MKSIRDQISYVPQISKILSGTVLENITFEKENENINMDIVREAIDSANASEFAILDKFLNQNGNNLSGGQKQRIGIARAIYKNSSLMIFDDSFSALDNVTDKIIRNNLTKLDRMKIIISQKISTVMTADKIIVLNDGYIVSIGKHSELLEKCEIYRQIYETQIGGSL